MRALTQVLSLIVLSRLLLPSDFGHLAVVLALVGFAEGFRDFGLSLAAVRAETLTRQEASNLFWLNCSIGAALSITMFLLSGPISSFFSSREVLHISMALSPVFLVNGIATQLRVTLIRRDLFGRLALIDASAPVLALVLAIHLAAQGASYWALVAQQLALYLYSLTAVWVSTRWLPLLPSRDASVRRFLNFSLPVLCTRIITYGGMNFDKIVVGRYFSPATTGEYSRAYQMFALPMTQAVAPLTNLAVSVLSRAQQRGLADFHYSLRKMQVLSSYGAALLLGFMAGSAQLIVETALGPNWSQTTPILQILAFGGVFQVCGIIYFWAFIALDLPRLHLRCALVTQPLSVVLVLVGLPFGVLGVATGASVALLLEWAGSAVYAAPRMGLPRYELLRQAVLPISISTSILVAIGGTVRLLHGHLGTLASSSVGWAVAAAIVVISCVFKRVRMDLAIILRAGRSILKGASTDG